MLLSKCCRKPVTVQHDSEGTSYNICDNCLKACDVIEEENMVIKPIPGHKSVKLSSTLAGQRELLRELKNKTNEIVKWVNQHNIII